MLNCLHLINPTVAFNTTYSAINVSGVIEIYVIRSLVHLNPLDWLASCITFSDRCQLRRIVFDDSVAAHACAGGRHI